MAGYYKYFPVFKNKADNTRTRWSEKKKMEAVATYVRTGNQDLTARLTGIPEPTIEYWRRQDWWNTALASIQAQEGAQLDRRMSRTLESAMEAIEDRLTNGDYILDSKTGRVIRIPPKMRETAQVVNILFDKRQLIRNQPTKITDNKQSQDELLKKIANNFEKLVLGRTPQEIEAEDVEIIEETNNAVHEEQEEGLQEGESIVQLETVGSEEAGRAEQSESQDDKSREG